MPILSQIELFLDGIYPLDGNKRFIFQSRCACNYLERHLTQKEFHTTASRINIFCTQDEKKVGATLLKDDSILEVYIKYSLDPSWDKDIDSLQSHYREIIDLGLAAALRFMTVPHSHCMQILRRFEAEGFQNQWVQSEKSWRSGFSSRVSAQLTTEKFLLKQYILRDSSPILEKIIVETLPREGLFIDYLGTLSLDRSGNIIYKRKGKTLSKFDVESGELIVLAIID